MAHGTFHYPAIWEQTGLELTGNVSSVGNVTSVSSRDGHNQLAEVSQRIAVKEIIGWLIDSRLVGEGTATRLKRDIYLYYWLLLEYLSIVRMPLEQPV